MTPYNSIAERVRAIASRIRLPEGGNAIERYPRRGKRDREVYDEDEETGAGHRRDRRNIA